MASTSRHLSSRRWTAVKSNIFESRRQIVKIYPAASATVGETWDDGEVGEPVELRALVRVGSSTVAADLPADQQPSSSQISLYFSEGEADRLRDRLVIGCRIDYAGQDYEVEDVDLLGARPVSGFSCKVTARRVAA